MNKKHHKIVFPRIPQILIVSCYENSKKKRKLNGLERLLRHLTDTASRISSGNVDFFPHRENLGGVPHLDELLLLLFLPGITRTTFAPLLFTFELALLALFVFTFRLFRLLLLLFMLLLMLTTRVTTAATKLMKLKALVPPRMPA